MNQSARDEPVRSWVGQRGRWGRGRIFHPYLICKIVRLFISILLGFLFVVASQSPKLIIVACRTSAAESLLL